MFDVFGSVKGLIKLDSVNIDNNIFRLHYKATVIILIAFSLLVTSRQYIGDPIDCVSDKIPGGYLDTYCWIHATFTIPDRLNGSGVIHPGVSVKREGDTLKYHKYYQWVCFVLFFQAMFFYFPRYLWKNLEAGKMESLVLDLTNPIIDESTKRDRKKLLVNYFTTNMHNHNSYAVRFFLCEVLNFVNVIVQIYFVDTFLGGEFTTYGSDVLRLSQLEPKDRFDPMAKVLNFKTY